MEFYAVAQAQNGLQMELAQLGAVAAGVEAVDSLIHREGDKLGKLAGVEGGDDVPADAALAGLPFGLAVRSQAAFLEYWFTGPM